MPIPSPRKGEKQNEFVSRCMSSEAVKREFGKGSKQAQAVCFSRWKKKNQSEDNLILEWYEPIKESYNKDDEFMIGGTAISETTTSNGHTFIADELRNSANGLIGVPLLKDHNNSVDAIVGRVKDANFDENNHTIPFRASLGDSKMKELVQKGYLNTVSVGAHVKPEDLEELEDGTLIPHNIHFKELSLVAIPADSSATFNVALNNAYQKYKSNLSKDSLAIDNELNKSDAKMTEEEQKQENLKKKPEEKPEEDKEEKSEEDKEEKPEEKSEEKSDVSERLDKIEKSIELIAEKLSDKNKEKEVKKSEKKTKSKPKKKKVKASDHDEEKKEDEDESEEDPVNELDLDEKGYTFEQGEGDIRGSRISVIRNSY